LPKKSDHFSIKCPPHEINGQSKPLNARERLDADIRFSPCAELVEFFESSGICPIRANSNSSIAFSTEF
jgi:hypothetical protein